jgi:hypothetical protein
MEEQSGFPLIEEVIHREASQIHASMHFAEVTSAGAGRSVLPYRVAKS